MDCPVCKCPLIVVERNRIELDHCIACKGLWFDSGELRALLASLNIEASLPGIMSLNPTASSEKKRNCPRCRKKMDKVMLGEEPGVLIDRCTTGDGMWFDQGELGTVMDEQLNHSSSGEHHIINFLGETFGTKDQ